MIGSSLVPRSLKGSTMAFVEILVTGVAAVGVCWVILFDLLSSSPSFGLLHFFALVTLSDVECVMLVFIFL